MTREALEQISAGNALRKAGQVDEAVAAYRRALQAAPDLVAGHYNLGIALRQKGDLRGSAIAFRDVARRDPRDFEAIQNVLETIGLAIDQELPRLFPHSPAAPIAQPAPISIVVCSIDPRREEAMRRNYGEALGNRPHEIIVIHDAKSLCEGYQRGLDASRHEIVVFSHDDVDLASPAPFDAFERALESSDIAGVAGSLLLNGPGFSWAGNPHLRGGVGYPPATFGKGWRASVYSVDTGILPGMQVLDGLIFAVRRDAARQVGFDAATFDAFHFYDVDFTYRAHLAGLRIAVTTELVAIHASQGQFDDNWLRYADRFRAKFAIANAPPGHTGFFGRDFATRDRLLRFYDEFQGLGAHP
jgi:GT2 family glycosyltransferase